MNFVPRAVALAIPAAFAALACQPPQAPEAEGEAESRVVAARVDGEPIHVADLDAHAKEQLFLKETRNRNQGRLYDLRKDALEEVVRQRVLEKEAARRQLSVEEMLDAEAEALGPVSDDEIRAFYEENRSRITNTLEEVTDPIRSYLEANRRQEAAAKLVERSEVQVLLEPPRFEVAAEGPALGPQDAAVTIVEFSDFQCPFCQKSSEVVKQVLERYPQQVRLVYRQFPLESIHPRARAAAEASLCAADQDRFWDYHDLLFARSRQLADEQLVEYAGELELDAERFEQCLSQRTHKAAVDRDLQQGSQAGVQGTPAFFVNGILLTGALPLERFTEVIDAELARAQTAGSS